MRFIYKTTFVAITAVLLQSCIATKEYQKPEVWNNASFNTNEVVKDSMAESVVPWQQIFTDALLQQHIQTALENNLDIRAALEKHQSSAIVSVARQNGLYAHIYHWHQLYPFCKLDQHTIW